MGNSNVSPPFRLLDALWCGDRERLGRELTLLPTGNNELDDVMRAWVKGLNS